MNSHVDRISRLEAGKVTPTLLEFCKLSVIYGRSFETLFFETMTQAKKEVCHLLPSLPESSTRSLSRFNRNNTLNRLASQLEGLSSNHHDKA